MPLASGSEGSEDDETEAGSTAHKKKKMRRFKRLGIVIVNWCLKFMCCIASESAGSLSPRSVANLRAEIENERAKLMATKGLAEGERNQAQKKLEDREEELKRAQQQQLELEQKLNELNSKVCRYNPLCIIPVSSILYITGDQRRREPPGAG